MGRGRGRIPAAAALSACPDGTGAVLEQWPPIVGSVEETIRLADEWAKEGVAYLRKLMPA